MSEEMPGLPGMKLMEVRIETADGRIGAKVGVADMPTYLSETVAWMHALEDRLVSLAIRREAKAGRSLSCKAGCGACCRQLVPLAIPEAFHLQEVVQALPPERQEVIKKRFEDILAKLASTGLLARLESDEYDPENPQAEAREYFELQMACPFLEDESCGIHKDRPLACRDFNVTTPAEWCSEPFAHAIDKIRVAKRLTTVLARLAHERLDKPARLIPLVLALEFARKNPVLDDLSWQGPELFGRLMDLVAEQQSPAGEEASDNASGS